MNLTEEQYLSINGASRQGLGDSALHKNKGKNSDKAWSKIVEMQSKKDIDLLYDRERLRLEYRLKVSAGEIKTPTRIELLIITANGLLDNEQTHAARRLLNKRGIKWNENI